MKEQVYTIPLMDAFRSGDECPFCFIERALEQHAINFVLGSGASYMEEDIREQTDATGFCREHYKKLYDYGNRLGMSLILSTHMKKKNKELNELMDQFAPGKSGMLGMFKKVKVNTEQPAKTSIGQWVQAQESSCYVCDYSKGSYARYLDTFFELYRRSDEFKKLFENCKGFCLPHFGDITEAADVVLTDKEKTAFFEILFDLMRNNMARVHEDVLWFVDKFDYRNINADWKNSKDAVPRTMQKMAGGHPADPPFEQDK